ncbi:MAG: hypothetical protein DRI84_04900 [Bacteroidetes bacterium]|nr:MAG: hypothetical protein DRI84_04900 [Bacteroidota bacterium]
MEKSDWELLTLLVENNSRQVQSEFFNRYKSFLLQICRIRCKHFDGGEQLAEDIFQNTMIKALNGINLLHKRISVETTNTQKHIKAWLATIARNEFREFLRKNPEEKKLSNPFRLKIDEIEVYFELNDNKDEVIEKPTINKEKLDAGLSLLSDREKHILLVYMEYYNPIEPNRHLPDNVIAQLCNQYNINSTNLRQIKSRSLRKLMIAINDKNI